MRVTGQTLKYLFLQSPNFEQKLRLQVTTTQTGEICSTADIYLCDVVLLYSVVLTVVLT